MQAIGNNIHPSRVRLVMRVSQNALSFSVIDSATENNVVFEPYIIKSGISLAANLREAFNDIQLLNSGYQRVQVMVDSQVMLVPIEEFAEENAETMYWHVFTHRQNDAVVHSVLPELNAVALFSINKDLQLVINDHFQDARFDPVTQPVWNYLHQRSFRGMYQKVYAYFHDKRMDVFSFKQNRFRFCNAFHVTEVQDIAYYLLYAWKVLALDVERDELHLVGDVPERELLTDMLHRYVQKVYYINPSAEFNRAPISQIKGMPFDLMTLFLKGK